MSKIIVDDSGCWVWQGTKMKSGYGVISLPKSYSKSTSVAHRVSWEVFVGPIPDSMVLDHLCGNRACINVEHLEVTTFGENTRRAQLKHPNRKKTHCPKGHPYDGDNLKMYGERRRCRACANEATVAWREKQNL